MWYASPNGTVYTDGLPLAEPSNSDNDLTLLLLRPSISNIFAEPEEKSLIDPDVVISNFGIYKSNEFTKHVLERLPILCINESCYVGYTLAMRFDLRLCLHQLANNANPPIEYPLGLFTNRDVIIVMDGLYTVRLGHTKNGIVRDNGNRESPDSQQPIITTMAEEFSASQIIYSATVIDEEIMTNLRRLEATAEQLLTPKLTALPRLPSEIITEWQNDFLAPIFKRAKRTGGNKK